MTGVLVAANAEELGDLSMWLEDHPADMDVAMRWTAQSWLDGVRLDITSYPVNIVVPSDCFEAMEAVIEDWTEILTAHDDEFLTTLEADDAG